MSSSPPGLPPAHAASALASARMQDVVVKLVSLPENLKNNPAPVRLSGTVTGQDAAGTTQVQTQRGIVHLLLKDRGTLPQGAPIEIDIPAGRSPQSATIRSAAPTTAPSSNNSSNASATTTSAAPGPTTTAQASPQQNTTAAPPLKLDRSTAIRPDLMGSTLEARNSPPLTEAAPLSAPIQPGQLVRLLPLPPGTPLPLPQTQLPSLLQILDDLATLAEPSSPPEIPTEIKTGLASILSQLDLPTLASGLTSDAASNPNGGQDSIDKLISRIQNMLQQADLQGKNDSQPQRPTPGTFTIFNPSKPIDGQIIGFQGLTTTNTPTSSAASLAAPLLPAEPATTDPSAISQAPSAQPSPAAQNGLSPPPTVKLPLSQDQVLIVSTGNNPTDGSPLLLGQVTGFTKNNMPIITIPVPGSGFRQSYVVQFPTNNLPAGGAIFVSLQSVGGKSLQIESSATLAPPPINLTEWVKPGPWEALQEFFEVTSQGNPTIAQNIMQLTPSPHHPDNLGPVALLFLAAMKTGDLGSWLPAEALSMLRQAGRESLQKSIAVESALIGKLDTIALSGDWRAAMIPLLWQNEIHKLPFYYKQMDDNSEKEANRRAKRLRFLFQLKLSRMGDVQVDGFLQQQRLDVILRTKTPLSPPMQQTMKQRYTAAIDKSNLTGELGFQFKPEHWVTLDLPAEGQTLVI